MVVLVWLFAMGCMCAGLNSEWIKVIHVFGLRVTIGIGYKEKYSVNIYLHCSRRTKINICKQTYNCHFWQKQNTHRWWYMKVEFWLANFYAIATYLQFKWRYGSTDARPSEHLAFALLCLQDWQRFHVPLDTKWVNLLASTELTK